MIIDKRKLDSLVDEGWLTRNRHDELPLSIYCYSRQTEYENHWIDETIMCRGIVVDDDGEIIFNCMPKFFNLGQPEDYYSDELKNKMAKKLDEASKNKNVLIASEKLDGSLIKVVNSSKYGLIVTSKTSFENEFVNKALAIIERDNMTFEEDISYSFELIVPENRIVVDYGNERKLVLLSVRNKDGKELSIDWLQVFNDKFKNFCIPNSIDVYDLKEYLEKDNIEGIVVGIKDDYENVYRLKIKSEQYLKLHRIRTECTPKRVWEILKEGKRLCDYDLPDEFIEDLLTVQTDLLEHYHAWHKFAREQSYKCVVIEEMTKKDIAMCDRYDNFEKSLIFGVVDRKNIDESIWRKIKPKGELND